jgi:LPXTG-site transpeptidase (sortase) family protein
VGWYELGPRPGERGNAVLVGHNLWEGHAGAFSALGRLKVGDRITVATSPPAHFVYAVERVVTYPTGAAPIGEIFGPSSDPVLTLITCAGRPDARGEYPERLVVRARAAG